MPIISGIKCGNDVADTFLEMRDKRKHRYIFYRIRKGPRSATINMGKFGKRDATFLDFLKDLPKEEPRFIVYDFSYLTDKCEKRDRILFLFWSPDHARLEDRTIYSATKATILAEIQKFGSIKQTEICEREELTEKYLINVVQPIREKKNSLS